MSQERECQVPRKAKPEKAKTKAQEAIPNRKPLQAPKRPTTLPPPPPRAKPEGWFERLSAALLEHAAQPFEYGTSDCLSLVADAVKAQTGENIYPLTGRAKTKKGAEKALLKRGVTNIGDAIAKRFNEIPLAAAHVGDIVTVLNDDYSVTCGIVVGSDIVVKDKSGNARLPRHRAQRAFRVEAPE